MTRNLLSRAIACYAHTVATRCWPVLGISLLAVAFMTYGLRYFESGGSDYSIHFPTNDPRVELYEFMKREYAAEDNIFFVVTSLSGNVFDRAALDAVNCLSEEAWQLPHAIRVDSLTTFQHIVADEESLTTRPLIHSPQAMTDEELEEARDIALNEPLLRNKLVKEGSAATGVNVAVHIPGDEPHAEMRITAAARDLRESVLNRHPEVAIRVTGLTAVDTAFYLSDMRDLRYLAPTMLAIIVISMLLLLKSVLLTFALCAVVVFSALSALGVFCWVGNLAQGTVNLMPLVVMTLAVADCIHILVGAQLNMGKGMGKHAAIATSLEDNLAPVFTTSLTTAIGFLCMNISTVPTSRIFGNYAAIGVLIAFLLAISLLPALFAALPLKQRIGSAPSVNAGLGRLAEFVIRRKTALLLLNGSAFLVAAFQVPGLEINNQFVEWFNRSHPIRQDTEYAMEHLTTIYQIMFHLPSGEEGGIAEPEYLARIDAFAEWLRERDEIIQVSSIADTMKRLNMAMHGSDPDLHTLPESRDMAAQYLLLYEMSLPAGVDFNTEMTTDRSGSRIVATTANLRSHEIVALACAAESWQRDHLPEDMYSPATGAILILAEVGHDIMNSMMYSAPLALLLVSLVMAAALRSVKYGLLSIPPNVAPLALGFGLWALMGRDINFGMATVVTMSIGIVVDDTVHFMSKYLLARQSLQLSAEDATRHAFASVGRAMWATSFVLIAGFLVMTLSQMNIFHAMGSLTCLIIVAALVCDFLMLPPMLLFVDRAGKPADK